MTSREQFEDKFEEITGWEADEYPNRDYVDTLWQIWDASRAEIEVELPSKQWDISYDGSQHYDCDEVHESLKQAGLKVKE